MPTVRHAIREISQFFLLPPSCSLEFVYCTIQIRTNVFFVCFLFNTGVSACVFDIALHIIKNDFTNLNVAKLFINVCVWTRQLLWAYRHTLLGIERSSLKALYVSGFYVLAVLRTVNKQTNQRIQPYLQSLTQGV